MLRFLCQNQNQLIVAASNVSRVLGIPPKLLELPLRPFSTVKSESPERSLKDEQQSVTLSYLINSCGLSPKAANAASKKVSLKSPENSDLVLSLLRNHGFSDAHITRMVTKAPSTLVAHPEKTILPKLEFFQSMGMPAPILARVISERPDILRCSLEKRIIPFYEYMKNLLLEDDKVITVFRRSARHYILYSLRRIPSNVAFLMNYGVSKSNISFLVVQRTCTLMMRSDGLVDLVNRVVEFGIDISKLAFVQALRVLHTTSKSAWESRKKLYLRWGWSESDLRMAFSVHPICMSLSEKKIASTMEFLVNEMNCEPQAIARSPTPLLYSLEKRIVPRCRVVKLLMARGLIKESYSLASLLVLTNEKFLERFVLRYENVPHLVDVYRGNLGLLDLGFTSSELANVKLL